MRSVSLFCFVLIFFCFYDVVGALKSGDAGVCEVNVSVTKTRVKYVKINKWCGKKKCVVKKTEKYNVPQKQQVCCKGYEYNATEELCKPICSTGCEGGHCTAPEICSCDPPMYLDVLGNICRHPICEPSCVNGLCIANNTCECEPDSFRLNSTYCLKCEEGFSLRFDRCVPVCDKECIGSYCAAPNTCKCFEGYEKKDDQCEPICNCTNATCIAPLTCKCFDGYEETTTNVCKPKCDSCAGECIGPNMCKIVCAEGYTMVGGVCTPVCDCENGRCVEPNVCECDQGYVKNGSVCVRDCSQPLGDDIPELSAVNKDRKDVLCYKDCDEAEEKAMALKDDEVCCYKRKCCLNYKYDTTTKTCIPRCRNKCLNGGVCIAPETCQCPPGLVSKGKYLNKCEAPVCDPPCINGECYIHGECTCLPNHNKLNTTHCCDIGYENKDGSCAPTCTNGCKFGTCTAPNTCTCLDGYMLYTSSECRPICKDSCVNAKCTAPDVCTCDEGYTKKEENDSFCTKPCDGPCLSGKCTDHGECICDFGYTLQNGSCIALPVDCNSCENECESGVCQCKDKRPCTMNYVNEVTSTGLASIQISWIVGGAIGLLLIVLVLVVMFKHYQKRRILEHKAEQYNPDGYSSVVFTVPDTLIQHNIPDNIDEESNDDVEHAVNKLLSREPNK